ncbi:MAG: hypothetical protein AAF495_14745 [Pseudomonadota bacterium]
MPPDDQLTTASLECCPTLEKAECCDRLDFKYTLRHSADVSVSGRRATIPVDVTLIVRYERCPGPHMLGDLAYSTTLLPGEKVRLFTSDRRSRFSYDKDTELSYRHAQATEENYYMSSVAREMYDLDINESGSASSHVWGEWGADMDSSYGSVIFAGGAEGSIDGSYDDRSTREFARSLSQHAEATHSRSEQATRTTSAVSIGEVSTRTHAEGESESHLESSSRVFSNPNKCHALTFFFWRIHRKQTVKFSVVAIERKARDPAAPTDVNSRPPLTPTGVSVVPNSVVGTADNRLEAESRAQQSIDAKRNLTRSSLQSGAVSGRFISSVGAVAQPISPALREAAVKQVDQGLLKAGMIDKVGGRVSAGFARELSWVKESCLPTPGIFVKGCLDHCDICEDEVKKDMTLDLERKALENELLKKQIELLEKSQEYRCCPAGEEETEPVQP